MTAPLPQPLAGLPEPYRRAVEAYAAQAFEADTALLSQALEALELASMNGKSGLYRGELQQVEEAVAALRARLEGRA